MNDLKDKGGGFMARQRTVTIFVILLGLVLLAVLVYMGGGSLARMLRAHMGG